MCKQLADDAKVEGLVIAPCGIGKSICFTAILNKKAPGHAIVFMPLLQLITQVSEVFEDNRDAGYPFEIVVISSDTGSTNAEKIVEQARKAEADGKKVLILCTYRSAPVAMQYAEIMKAADEKWRFGIVCCDEAHNISRRGNSEYANAARVCLDIPCQHRIYLTATPTVELKKDIAADRILYQMSWEEAIRGGCIVPLRLCGLCIKTELPSALADGDVDRDAQVPRLPSSD